MIYYGQELYHFGIPGQKWGQRRWQNPDGSLTEEGRIHYGYGELKKRYKQEKKELRKAAFKQAFNFQVGKKRKDAQNSLRKKTYNLLDTKADLKSYKKKDDLTKEKARAKVYIKAMRRYGIQGSSRDRQMGNMGTELYNHLEKKYGSEYVSELEKNVIKREAISSGATAALGVIKNIGNGPISMILGGVEGARLDKYY